MLKGAGPGTSVRITGRCHGGFSREGRRTGPHGTDPPRIGILGSSGILQVDGYAASQALADPGRAGGPVTLAYCWSHVRRRFYEIAQGGNAPIAEEALQRINVLYQVEAVIRGQAPQQRQAIRHEHSRPVLDDLRTWLDAQLAKVPRRARIAEAIRYALKLWSGLRLFLDDGRIEIDTNVVERAIRPIALNRKNALFAGSDQGGVHWGVIASLSEACKLNAVDPQAEPAFLIRGRCIGVLNRPKSFCQDDLGRYRGAPGCR